jgi:hypothetical protein
LIILTNVISLDCKGQMTAKLTQPQLTLIKDSLIIKYNILGVNPKDMFNVRLEITDNTGAKINAASFSGDIGDSVKGGVNKQIIWNLAADNVFISSNINVEIFASRIIVSEVAAQEKNLIGRPSDLNIEEKDLSEIPADMIEKKETGDIKESHKMIEEPAVTATKVKTGKHMLQSAIFPGWGLTSLSKGKPYWLIGIAGAGCIASSIYFNQHAYTNYNNYLDSWDREKIDAYFNNAKTQYNLSKVFAYSAAAIWASDLVVVFIKAGSMNKSYRHGKSSAFSVSPCFDASTETPVLTLHFNFW